MPLRPAGQGLPDRQRDQDRENMGIDLLGSKLRQDDLKGSPSGVKWVFELLVGIAQAQQGLPTSSHTDRSNKLGGGSQERR